MTGPRKSEISYNVPVCPQNFQCSPRQNIFRVGGYNEKVNEKILVGVFYYTSQLKNRTNCEKIFAWCRLANKFAKRF